jgi:octaprenyl-diphosphate synthase
MRILSKTTNQIAEGEVLQLLNIRNDNVSQTKYFNVIEQKTARLFEAACKIGALLSDSSEKTINSLGDFGLHLGIAFQIIDDALDYESDPTTMGKEVGDDLSEGKITLPMIYALEKTSGSENKILRDAIKTADASNIDKIINILCSVNAFEFTRKIAENESQKALKSLKNIPDSEYRSALKLLCELSLNRTS